VGLEKGRSHATSTSILVDARGDEGGYGSPKPKRGGDEDADHYDSSEEVNWKGLESAKLWEKKETGAWQTLKKKTYTYILTFAYGGT